MLPDTKETFQTQQLQMWRLRSSWVLYTTDIKVKQYMKNAVFWHVTPMFRENVAPTSSG
jgi:hypothetical protein